MRAPLGYLTDQLRLRFGASQPQAVITVLQASQSPVTLEALQSELTAIDNLLVTGSREETALGNDPARIFRAFRAAQGGFAFASANTAPVADPRAGGIWQYQRRNR